MLQVLQDLKNGKVEVAQIPQPTVKPGHLLIATERTLISSGTERMMLDFGRAGWVNKARQQPDKVRMVLDKVKTDGLMPTVEAVRDKLDQPLGLGYSNCGVVLEVGEGVTGFSEGDRVVSNGPHAEIVSVPVNLCAKVPDNVSSDHAAFTVLGGIALQGIRLANPTLGECVVVTGLGLIGLLTVQLLRANGCRVLGIDFDKEKLKLAKSFGAEVVDLGAGQDPVKQAMSFSRGRGVDAVLITASTSSSEPVMQAVQMSRKKGRVVLVGVTGLELSRTEFFKKEVSFQVSCSYGPGRYDPSYEELGHDYPVAYVRWTEQRNFEAILDSMASKAIDIEALISHRYKIGSAPDAYELIASGTPSLGLVLEYPTHKENGANRVEVTPPNGSARASAETVNVGFIGSGNYAMRMLMPAFQAAGAGLHTSVSSRGVTGTHAAKKFNFRYSATSSDDLLNDKDVNAVVIATRHNTHVDYVLKALEAGKSVFVEKPLALTLEEAKKIDVAYQTGAQKPVLMVGFNRRFSPQIQKMKALLESVQQPKAMILTVNAGEIPPEHWTQSLEEGGRRLIGEGCHFIDLARFLAGSPIIDFQVTSMEPVSKDENREDRFTLTLKFRDGSIATIHYFFNGHKSFPKERVEVFCGGKVIALDNYRKMEAWGFRGFSKMNLWSQDKGQRECVRRFVEAVKTGTASPIPYDEVKEVAEVTIRAAEQLRQ